MRRTLGAARMALAVALVVVLAGCALARVEEPDPGTIPDGPLVALGADASGPVTELGRGRTSGIGWRYAVYEIADGWCTQLETASLSSSGCGDLLFPRDDGSPFGTLSHGDSSVGPAAVDGVVTGDVSAVMVETSTGNRLPTTLMPLDAAGLDGHAFVGFVPAGVSPRAVIALGPDGEVLGSHELP